MNELCRQGGTYQSLLKNSLCFPLSLCGQWTFVYQTFDFASPSQLPSSSLKFQTITLQQTLLSLVEDGIEGKGFAHFGVSVFLDVSHVIELLSFLSICLMSILLFGPARRTPVTGKFLPHQQHYFPKGKKFVIDSTHCKWNKSRQNTSALLLQIGDNLCHSSLCEEWVGCGSNHSITKMIKFSIIRRQSFMGSIQEFLVVDIYSETEQDPVRLLGTEVFR